MEHATSKNESTNKKRRNNINNSVLYMFVCIMYLFSK